MKSGLLTLCLQSVSPDNRKLDIDKDKTEIKTTIWVLMINDVMT